MQRIGGLAALYTVFGYGAAVAYFVFLVDYPSVQDPAQKVALLREHQSSMLVMHVISFELTALALILVALAVHARLRAAAPSLALVGLVIGVVRCALLLSSVMIFNHGMAVAVDLSRTDPTKAAALWQPMETIADSLGGSGGELLGGLWVLTVSGTALRSGLFPVFLNWFGLLIGAVGVASLAPPLSVLEAVFGLLQIAWLIGLGITLLRAGRAAQGPMAAQPREQQPH